MEAQRNEFGYGEGVGEYEMKRILAINSQNEVWVGINPRTGELAAIKILNKEKGGANTKRELHTLGKLQGFPHIIKVKSIQEDELSFVVVMEYLQDSLYDHLQRKGKLSETEARRLFVQMTEAVAACHGHGIVHRDLKLENFLYDKRADKVFLIDFGLCGLIRKGKLFAKACGSRAYSAPELILDRPYDESVDIWALGVILYALLCGHFPFGGDREEVRQQIVKRGVGFPSHLSPAVKDLILRMLCKNRKKRITLAGIKEHEWVKMLPVEETPPAPVPNKELLPPLSAIPPSEQRTKQPPSQPYFPESTEKNPSSPPNLEQNKVFESNLDEVLPDLFDDLTTTPEGMKSLDSPS